jgi:phage-related protein (TIGR01555 family)
MMAKKLSIKAAAAKAKALDAQLREQAQSPKSTVDSFVNFAQSLGIGADTPLTTATYGFNPITRIRTVLEWIHRGNWIGGVAVDMKADDMTRSGVEIQGSLPPGTMEKLEAEMHRLKVWHAISSTVKWAKLYGGAISYIMTDQDPSTPLRIDTIGKGGFKGVCALDRWSLEPSLNNLVTEPGPELGKPKFYTVSTMAPMMPNIRIHHTRCIRMVGIELPHWQAMTENLWGISVYERMYDRMQGFDSATTGVAQLIYKSYLRTLKIKGLRELIATGGRAYQALLQQVDLMRRFQNIEGISLLDGEDEFEAQSHSAFSGLSDALVQMQQQVSGALQIPLVRLFGQSPAGFNSGDNDLRMYYDSILQEQNRDLLDGVTKMYKIGCYSIGVAPPEDFGIVFRPLWQQTETEKATTADAVTRTVVAALDAGLISEQTAAKELRQSSKETGVFTNITDEDINNLADEPVPKAEPAAFGEEPPLPGVPGNEPKSEPSSAPKEPDGSAQEVKKPFQKG